MKSLRSWILKCTGLSRKERPWGISWMRCCEGMLSSPNHIEELSPALWGSGDFRPGRTGEWNYRMILGEFDLSWFTSLIGGRPFSQSKGSFPQTPIPKNLVPSHERSVHERAYNGWLNPSDNSIRNTEDTSMFGFLNVRVSPGRRDPGVLAGCGAAKECCHLRIT